MDAGTANIHYEEDNHHNDDDDIYIMVKCLCVCVCVSVSVTKVIISVFKGFGRFSCFQTLPEKILNMKKKFKIKKILKKKSNFFF